MENLFDLLFMLLLIVSALGITTLMSISDGLDPCFFRRKMEKTWSMKEELDGEVFVSRQSRQFSFIVNNMIKVIFPICTLNWRVNNYVYHQEKGIKKRNETTFIFI